MGRRRESRICRGRCRGLRRYLSAYPFAVQRAYSPQRFNGEETCQAYLAKVPTRLGRCTYRVVTPLQATGNAVYCSERRPPGIPPLAWHGLASIVPRWSEGNTRKLPAKSPFLSENREGGRTLPRDTICLLTG